MPSPSTQRESLFKLAHLQRAESSECFGARTVRCRGFAKAPTVLAPPSWVLSHDPPLLHVQAHRAPARNPAAGEPVHAARGRRGGAAAVRGAARAACRAGGPRRRRHGCAAGCGAGQQVMFFVIPYLPVSTGSVACRLVLSDRRMQCWSGLKGCASMVPGVGLVSASLCTAQTGLVH